MIISARVAASAAALVLVTSGAWATDLPVKAQPRSPAAVVATNWTGIYVGGHFGALKGDHRHHYIDVVGAPLNESVSHRLNGQVGGIQVGANWQVGQKVLGVEGEWSWTNGKGNTACTPVNNGGDCQVEMKPYSAVSGRIGWAWDRLLLFAKGGYAFGGNQYYVRFATVPAGNEQGSDRRRGWLAGAGLEFAVTEFLSIKGEWNYVDFGTETVRLYLINTGAYDETARMRQTFHVAKVGVNFRYSPLPRPTR